MYVLFDDQVLETRQTLPLSYFDSLQFTWDDLDVYNTFVIYDIDAPSATNNKNSPYLHLLVTNVPGNDILSGDIVADLVLPNPPRGSGPHRYLVEVYQQDDVISVMEPKYRQKYNLESLIQNNGLRYYDRAIIVGNSDTDTLSLGSVVPLTSPSPRHRGRAPSPYKAKAKYDIFKSDSILTEPQQKYCSCVLKTTAKQTPGCLRDRAWRKERDGKTCYNPWAICAKSTGTSVGRSSLCSDSYNFEGFSDDQLIGYANLHGVSVAEPYNRQDVIDNIYSWKKSKYGK